MSKIKNIAIFVAIGVVLVLVYIYFIKPAPAQNGLVSTSATPVTTSTDTNAPDTLGTKDFLLVLLNVKNIKLDDTIFSDNAFSTLHDSSITLTADGTEGRPNPFAPIGTDHTGAPANTGNNTNGLNSSSSGTPSAIPSNITPKTN